MNNLSLRVLTGITGITLLVLLFASGFWGYAIAMWTIGSATQLELLQLLFNKKKSWEVYFFALLGSLFQIYLLLFLHQHVGSTPQYWLLALPAAYLLKLFDPKDQQPFVSLSQGFFSLAYAVLPFALLHTQVVDGEQYHFWRVMGLLILVWSNDTGAYFAGKYLGKHKLFERISPKKTWEGWFGGLVLTLVMGYLLGKHSGEFNADIWLVSALVVGVFGPVGDLIESQFKRSLHIKDSGGLLPGHGGFLDRFDAFLMATPMVVLVWILMS
jgi:phosphatidate cytidylyltransferase